MWSPQGSIFGPVFVCLYAVPLGLLLNSYFAMLMIHSYTFVLGPTTSGPSPTSANASLPLIFACIYIFSISTLVKLRLLCSALTISREASQLHCSPSPPISDLLKTLVLFLTCNWNLKYTSKGIQTWFFHLKKRCKNRSLSFHNLQL